MSHFVTFYISFFIDIKITFQFKLHSIINLLYISLWKPWSLGSLDNMLRMITAVVMRHDNQLIDTNESKPEERVSNRWPSLIQLI